MTDGDYARLVGLALALAAQRSCPICEAKVWKSTDTTVDLPLSATVEPAASVPVICGDCGYVLLFLCSYLDRKATKLKSEGNGQ
jgi:hypothetical protein